jgi:hypothetical protein
VEYIYVAYGCNILKINPIPNTPVVTADPIYKLPRGSFVWNIHYHNGLMYLLYTIDGNENTYIT